MRRDAIDNSYTFQEILKLGQQERTIDILEMNCGNKYTRMVSAMKAKHSS
jgi:hypothetical protein